MQIQHPSSTLQLTCAAPIIFFANGSSLFADALFAPPALAAPNANILGAGAWLAAPKANGVAAVAAGAGAAAAAAMPPNGDAAAAVDAAGAPNEPKVDDGTAAVGLAAVWPNWNCPNAGAGAASVLAVACAVAGVAGAGLPKINAEAPVLLLALAAPVAAVDCEALAAAPNKLLLDAPNMGGALAAG